MIGRNMNIENNAGKSSERSKKYDRGSLYRLGEYVYCHKLNIGRNMNIEGTAQRLRKK